MFSIQERKLISDFFSAMLIKYQTELLPKIREACPETSRTKEVTGTQDFVYTYFFADFQHFSRQYGIDHMYYQQTANDIVKEEMQQLKTGKKKNPIGLERLIVQEAVVADDFEEQAREYANYAEEPTQPAVQNEAWYRTAINRLGQGQ